MTPADRDRLMRRVGYYLIGLALGCVLLGMYFQGRRVQIAREQRAAEAARAAKESPGALAAPKSPSEK